MSEVFVVGFMMFLAGAVAGIVWRAVADVKYDRQIMKAVDEKEARHRRAIERKDAEIKRLFNEVRRLQEASHD